MVVKTLDQQRQFNPSLAPPGEQTRFLEMGRGLTLRSGNQMIDMASKAVVEKSNQKYNKLINRGMKSSMFLGKSLFGKVSSGFRVFGGLSRIMGGI